LTVVIAVVLIGYPLFLIYAITVPVAQFRTGRYVDFLGFAVTVVAIYGGVLLGAWWQWAKAGRAGQRVRPAEVFKAGVLGALVVAVVFVVGAGVRGLITQGSFEKGVGNLWGLIVILAVFLGALVSGGVALLFYRLRPSAESGRAIP
jgi:hypothetical protein